MKSEAVKVIHRVGAVNARLALLDAAERLYAERGLEGVALSDIAQAAHQKNSSVVHYYFGGRNGLVLEVFRRRMQDIDKKRLVQFDELARQGLDRDVRALVEASIRPLSDFIEESGPHTYYARFIEQALASVSFANGDDVDLLDLSNATRAIHRSLLAALDHLPHDVVKERIRLTNNLVVSGLADYERRRASKSTSEVANLDETTANLVDMVTAALTVTPTTNSIKRPELGMHVVADADENSPGMNRR